MTLTCASCTHPIADGDAFCEACGAATGTSGGSSSDQPGSAPAAAVSEPADPPPAPAGSCPSCGTTESVDGYCATCGVRLPTLRDHWFEQPVPRVAGVCDRGVVHARNEDAMAIAALDHESFAALVVCDGVTTAPESDRASLAAARAACAAIVSGGAAPPGSSAATRVAHYSAVLSAATDDAHAAAVAVARTLGDPPEPPSCTYLGLVDAGDLAVVSWCGDSRAYWVADDGTALQLMTDHSLGAEAVAAGKTREEAESDPAFHTITRWLGADSVDHTPEVVSHALSGAGWLVACSDGLWNYASGPEQMASLVVGLAAQHGDPLALARAMVRWANEQGGHDNITVVVSRHGATPVATV